MSHTEKLTTHYGIILGAWKVLGNRTRVLFRDARGEEWTFHSNDHLSDVEPLIGKRMMVAVIRSDIILSQEQP